VIITFVIAILNANVPDVLDISMPLANSTATRQFYQTYTYSWKSWSNPIPTWDLGIPEESAYSIYNLILLVTVFYFLKAVVDGTGGPTGYTAQRYFAAKSDKACGHMSLLWIVLLSFRWMFIGSIVLLGLTYNSTQSRIFDPEMILSTVVDFYMPTGIKGFLCAGLIAAGMSTFDSTINAGAAYWVKDLYQPYINPKASEKKLIWQSRISSVLIVVVGLSLMLVIRDINEVWGFFTMCIVGALSGPYMWRWFWWRVNAWGFTAGTIAGLVTAMTTVSSIFLISLSCKLILFVLVICP
jgi:Na+/proline symporter